MESLTADKRDQRCNGVQIHTWNHESNQGTYVILCISSTMISVEMNRIEGVWEEMYDGNHWGSRVDGIKKEKWFMRPYNFFFLVHLNNSLLAESKDPCTFDVEHLPFICTLMMMQFMLIRYRTVPSCSVLSANYWVKVLSEGWNTTAKKSMRANFISSNHDRLMNSLCLRWWGMINGMMDLLSLTTYYDN